MNANFEYKQKDENTNRNGQTFDIAAGWQDGIAFRTREMHGSLRTVEPKRHAATSTAPQKSSPENQMTTRQTNRTQTRFASISVVVFPTSRTPPFDSIIDGPKKHEK